MPELRLTSEQVDALQFSELSESHPEIFKLCVDWMNMFYLLNELAQSVTHPASVSTKS